MRGRPGAKDASEPLAEGPKGLNNLRATVGVISQLTCYPFRGFRTMCWPRLVLVAPVPVCVFFVFCGAVVHFGHFRDKRARQWAAKAMVYLGHHSGAQTLILFLISGRLLGASLWQAAAAGRHFCKRDTHGTTSPDPRPLDTM